MHGFASAGFTPILSQKLRIGVNDNTTKALAYLRQKLYFFVKVVDTVFLLGNGKAHHLEQNKYKICITASILWMLQTVASNKTK